MGGDGRPQVRHPWTQLGGPEEGVIRPPPTPGAPAADGERGRDLPLPLRSLLLRNDCFAEGNHRVPGLCADDHRSDDGRQRQVTAYSRDEGHGEAPPKQYTLTVYAAPCPPDSSRSGDTGRPAPCLCDTGTSRSSHAPRAPASPETSGSRAFSRASPPVPAG